MKVSINNYPEWVIKEWQGLVEKDLKDNEVYDEDVLNNAHSMGYLLRSIDKYDLVNNNSCDYITDIDYVFLKPFNNSFSKWINDVYTTSKVLYDYKKYLKEVYFSITKRDGVNLVFKANTINDREYTFKDIVDLLKEKAELELRPTYWKSICKTYKLRYEKVILVDDKQYTIEEFEELILNLKTNYVVTDNYDVDETISLYVANDFFGEATILDAFVSDQNGRFDSIFDNIEEIEFAVDKIKKMADYIKQLSYFKVVIKVFDESFKIIMFDSSPSLPPIAISDLHNRYLKTKVELKRVEEPKEVVEEDESAFESIRDILDKPPRPGMRPYMQSMWKGLIKDEFLNAAFTLEEKRWAWERGFLVSRVDEYSITEDNYRDYVSDYDYLWLNRINGWYQIWVNDKTTFKMVFREYNSFLAEYYYSIIKVHDDTKIIKMQDYPDDCSGIINLIRKKGKLVLKASAGTHGDGLYIMEHSNGKYYINDKEFDKLDLENLFYNLESFYILTEYIYSNEYIRAFNPKSLNTIRLVVANEKGYNPKILNSYMRIGTSESGYVDNTAKGGIWAYFDKVTGEIYEGLAYENYRIIPCHEHPDTKVKIEGSVKNINKTIDKVLEICRYYPELEYLGFDIAITDDSFKIIEINIHPDYPSLWIKDFREYLEKKVALKKKEYNI